MNNMIKDELHFLFNTYKEIDVTLDEVVSERLGLERVISVRFREERIFLPAAVIYSLSMMNMKVISRLTAEQRDYLNKTTDRFSLVIHMREPETKNIVQLIIQARPSGLSLYSEESVEKSPEGDLYFIFFDFWRSPSSILVQALGALISERSGRNMRSEERISINKNNLSIFNLSSQLIEVRSPFFRGEAILSDVSMKGMKIIVTKKVFGDEEPSQGADPVSIDIFLQALDGQIFLKGFIVRWEPLSAQPNLLAVGILFDKDHYFPKELTLLISRYLMRRSSQEPL